ncbi:unnamed protein product, partial [Linum tenue]
HPQTLSSSSHLLFFSQPQLASSFPLLALSLLTIQTSSSPCRCCRLCRPALHPLLALSLLSPRPSSIVCFSSNRQQLFQVSIVSPVSLLVAIAFSFSESEQLPPI